MSTTADDVVRRIKGVAQGLLGTQPNTAQFASPDQQQPAPQPPLTGGTRMQRKVPQSMQNASIPAPSGPASRVPGALSNPASPDNSAATLVIAPGAASLASKAGVGVDVPSAAPAAPPTDAFGDVPFNGGVAGKTIYGTPTGENVIGVHPDQWNAYGAKPAAPSVGDALPPYRTPNGFVQTPTPTNPTFRPATAANDASAAAPAAEATAAPGVATGATDAAAQVAAKGLFSRAAGLVSGLAKRAPLYTEGVQGARTLMDNRMITAGSDATGTARDVPQALAGSLIGAPLGMSPAETRTAMIRSNATDKAASNIVVSDPALSKQREAGSFWGDLANSMGGDLPPSSDQQYLNPAQQATANAAGVAAAVPEAARQNVALGQSDEVNHAARGGSVADRFLGTLNNFNPQRDSTNVTPAPAYDRNATPGKPYQPGDLAAATTAALKKGGATPAQVAQYTKGLDQPAPVAANLPAVTTPASANAAISLAKQVGSAFGLGGQPSAGTRLPNGQPPAPLDMAGSGTDSKGAFNLVRNADGSTSIQRGGKTVSGGSVNFVPDAAFSPETARAQAVRDSIAGGNTQANPSANLGVGGGFASSGGGSNAGTSSAMRDYQDTVRDAIKNLGPLNNNSKRQLLGELIGHLGQNVGVGANVGLEGARLAEQQAEFPQTLEQQREASRIGRYGLQPQVDANNGLSYQFDPATGTMRQLNTDSGKPFVGTSERDAAKQAETNTGVARDLYKTYMSGGGTGKTYNDFVKEVNEAHGQNSVLGSGAAPKVGTVQKGHVYTGGDPHDPKSWIPVAEDAEQ